MVRFAPRSQVPLPAAAGRNPLVPANAGPFPPAPGAAVDPVTTGSTGGPGGTVSFTTSSQPTLQALRERLQGLQQAAPELPTMAGMQSPWQGAAYLANTLVNSLQQRAAASAEQRGQQEMMKVFGQIDPATGATGEQISQIAQYDPEFAIKLWEDRSKRLNAEHWEPVPGQPGLYRNTVTGEPKFVDTGGSSGYKTTDVTAARNDFLGDTSYKNIKAASPIWRSLVDTAGRDTGASDLNFVYGIAKIFDPTSVVREGEIQMANSTGDVVSMIQGLWKKAMEGGSSMSPQVRQNLLNEARTRMEGYAADYAGHVKFYTDLAKRHGFDPADVVVPIEGIYTPEKKDDTGKPSPDATTPPDANNPPPPDTGGLPSIKREDLDAWRALPDGAQYTVPGDVTDGKPTVYTKKAKK